MISLFTWFGLKSPVMPANRYTSDSPTVLLNEMESPISSGMVPFAVFRTASSLIRTYDSFRLQRVDLLRLVSQFGEDLLRVLAQFGWGPAQRRRLPVVAHRVGEHAHRPGPRMLECHYRP